MASTLVMEESNVALHLLTELPDTEQELFFQLGKDLDTFTLFPKLAIEIRLKIYRLCFPSPRTVSISRPCPYLSHCTKLQARKADRAARRCPFPITLQINHESRKETLENYSILFTKDLLRFLGDAKSGAKDNNVVWFDYKRDRLYLRYCCIYSERLFSEWILMLTLVAPGRLERVKYLEIKNYSSTWKLVYNLLAKVHTTYDPQDPFSGLSTIRWVEMTEPASKCLLQFSGLEQLTLSLYDKESEIKPENIDEHQRAITEFLNLHPTCFQYEKIPQVVVRLR